MSENKHLGGQDGPEEEAALFARLEADLSGDKLDPARKNAHQVTQVADVDAAPGELDDLDGDLRPVVDPPLGREPWWGAGRASLVPAWLRDRASLVSAARWAAGTVVHVAVFHAIRLPLYWWRLAARSPVGAARLLAAWWRWAFDTSGRAMHQAVTTGVTVPRQRVAMFTGPGSQVARDRAADPAAGVTARLDAETFLRLASHHQTAVRTRLAGSALAVAVAIPLAASVAASLSVAARVLALAVLLPVLGLAGRAADRPVTSRATDSVAVPRLTSDVILTALGSLGIAELNKGLTKGDGVAFPRPITRDGPGWRADLDLPPGVTAGDVIERRDRLASGLRRPLGCVWPEVDPDTHAGRLVLWVGDRPLAAGKPVPWPLAKAGRVNIFEPVTVGLDQRHRPVSVTLVFAAGVVGAIPRMGKTFVLRLLALAGGLDPRVELHAYNLKGGSDFDPLALVAHAYRTGDDDEDVTYLLRDLRQLAADRRRRYKTLRALPREVCPESKVTDDLATRRDLGLHPVLVVIDECQLAFEHPTHGPELVALVTDLVKAGPAVGIMVWCATQRPDAKSLPRDISANAVLRLALKVTGQVENDMILGTSAYKNGTRATMLSRRDRGVAILAGEGDDPKIVRIAYVDGPTAETIAARARAARQLAGLLTGHALGVDPDTGDDTASVLDHLLEVWPPDQARAWCETLAERLATAWPGTYTGWTGEQVTAAVKPHGLSTVQVKRSIDGTPINRRGLDRTNLARAITQRDQRRNGNHPQTE